jgi:hypothetical protein
VREHDRVQLGVRQVEGAAEHVAKLVVQAHRGAIEAGAREPGAIEGARLRVVVVTPRRRDDAREVLGQRAHALFGEQRRDRVEPPRVEGLDRVRKGVQAARPGHGRGKRAGELRVVEHHARAHGRVAAGTLLAALGQPPD